MEDGEEVDFGWDAEETPDNRKEVNVIIKHEDLPKTKNLVKNCSFFLAYNGNREQNFKWKIVVVVDEKNEEKKVLAQLYKGYEYMEVYALSHEFDSIDMKDDLKGDIVVLENNNIDKLKEWAKQ